MRRRALLIGNPGEQDAENYCPGVHRDLTNYRSFLETAEGGLWQSGEIETALRPDRQAVQAAVQRVKASDYGFVVFCGHGHETANGQSTMLCLRANVEIDSDELRAGAPRQTLILDCCRRVERPQLVLKAMTEAARAVPPLTPSDCRRYYDERIAESPEALIVAFACKRGQTAGDDPNLGGFYSASLLNRALDWASQPGIDLRTNYRILGVPAAHHEAIPDVVRMSGGRQEPEIQKPRAEKYFPFCIVA